MATASGLTITKAYAAVQGGGRLECPTQRSFWSTFLRLSKSSANRKIIESFLFRYFLAYKKPPNRKRAASRREILNAIDVEEVFTFLSERISAPATSPQLRTSAQKVWEALVSEVGHVFSRFEANRETRRTYLSFMRQHVRNWDTVVSFNYDVVFEESIKRDYTIFYEGVQPRKQWQHRIIKPHGSVNWESRNGQIRTKHNPEKCVIVAPTHLKFVAQNAKDGAAGIPDLAAASRLFGIDLSRHEEVREALGKDFPKLPLHTIVCIGALIAHRDSDEWAIDALGAPHIGQRTEAQLIQSFVDKIADLRPRLVTFNGSSFDLPVLRYRAMVNRIAAPGLRARQYFYRYSDDALDLCDALSSFEGRSKVKLHDLSRMLGLPGKPDGIDGSMVESYVSQGRIAEVASYCESDVLHTYRIWLFYQRFLGHLTAEQLAASECQLRKFVEGARDATASTRVAAGLPEMPVHARPN